MNEDDVRVAADTRDILGEGPVWLKEGGVLAWVDIGSSAWHRLNLATGEVATSFFDVALTGFAPIEGGDFIGAFTDGIAIFDEQGRKPVLHRPEADKPGNRFNDAGCDPEGRFIAGTMVMDGDMAEAAFYSLESDGGLSVLRAGVTIANTVAFSRDGARIYLADTAKGELAAFHYDAATGSLGPRDATFIPPDDLPGSPDGSAVDAEGYLWNARWDGGCVARLRPDGCLDRLLSLPVSKPTSCAFVGETLYITTSTWGFGKDERQNEPLAGCLLAVDVGVCGVPRASFGGRAE